jgi:hypothetical protein
MKNKRICRLLASALLVPVVAVTDRVSATPTASFDTNDVCATASTTATIDRTNSTDFASMVLSTPDGRSVTYEAASSSLSSGPAPTDIQAAITLDKVFDGYTLVENLAFSAGGGQQTIRDNNGSFLAECPDQFDFRPGGHHFVPMTPTRILDTRPTSLLSAGLGARLQGGVWRVVDIAGTSIPFFADAVVLNVVAVNPSGSGFLSTKPFFGFYGPPETSFINFEAGGVVANQTFATLGFDGEIGLFSNVDVDVVVDIAGYFVHTLDPVAAGRFSGITPTRVLDTRPATLMNASGAQPGAGSVTTVDVTRAGVPVGGASAVAVNLTATDTASAGYVQAAAGGQLVPGATSSVNIDGVGQTVANMAVVAVSPNGTIDLFTLNPTHLVVDVLGWFSNESAAVSSSGLYYPSRFPERVLDTRTRNAVNYPSVTDHGVQSNKPGPTRPFVPINFDGLPAGFVDSVALNITITNSAGPGYVQAAPGGGLVVGASSNVNVVAANQTVPNGAVIKVDDNIQLQLFPFMETNLVALPPLSWGKSVPTDVSRRHHRDRRHRAARSHRHHRGGPSHRCLRDGHHRYGDRRHCRPGRCTVGRWRVRPRHTGR